MKRVARMVRGHRGLLLKWFLAKGQHSSRVVEGLKDLIPSKTHHGLRTYHALEVVADNLIDDLSQRQLVSRLRYSSRVQQQGPLQTEKQVEEGPSSSRTCSAAG